jgi:hypothetical protein
VPGIRQSARVRVQMEHGVPELLVVAVHLVDDLLGLPIRAELRSAKPSTVSKTTGGPDCFWHRGCPRPCRPVPRSRRRHRSRPASCLLGGANPIRPVLARLACCARFSSLSSQRPAACRPTGLSSRIPRA